jgi:hypothetical protein
MHLSPSCFYCFGRSEADRKFASAPSARSALLILGAYWRTVRPRLTLHRPPTVRLIVEICPDFLGCLASWLRPDARWAVATDPFRETHKSGVVNGKRLKIKIPTGALRR